MKKIKITEGQKAMLESKAEARLKEDISYSQSRSKKVTDAFKSAGADKVEGLKVEGEQVEDIQMSELAPKVLDFIKQLYTNPSMDSLDPFWGAIDVSWDELIQLLTELQLIKSVSGGYRLQKLEQVGGPTAVVRIVTKLVHKLINDKKQPVEEIETKDITGDYFKKQIGEPKKSGKSRVELLQTIARKRKEELDRRAAEASKPIGELEEDGGYPAGAQHDPAAPYNQVDPPKGRQASQQVLDLQLWVDEFAFFTKDGKLFVYNVESADNDEYAQYASREETPLGRDEDGDMDVEYGEWEMDEEIINNYVNDNISNLSTGISLDAWENGVELVEVDQALAQDLLGVAKYIKNPKTAQSFIETLKSIGLEETTSAGGGSSGSFVGALGKGPISRGPMAKSNVEPELKSMVNDGEEEGEPTMAHLDRLLNNGNVSAKEWLMAGEELKHIVMDIKDDSQLQSLVPYIVHLLQLAEKGREEEFNALRDKLIQKKAIVNPTMLEATTTVSAGGDSGTFAYDAPAGDGGKFWNAGNKMNKKMPLVKKGGVNESTNYRSGFEMNEKEQLEYNYHTEVNQMNKATSVEEQQMLAKRVREAAKKMGVNLPKDLLGLQEMVAREGKDAKTDTQWPDGQFVEFDDCTKYNNNKVAQNGGCSTGAVDNVVKTKSSKNSVISDSSIYESIAKETGRIIGEVKTILDRKNKKSR